MIDWEEIFDPYPVPNWFHDFDSDPFKAIDEALWGKYYFGPLNVADPADLLINWALGIENKNDFTSRLDDSLSKWIHKTWGQAPGANGKYSANSTAVAWIQLAQIVANVDSLQQAAKGLRQNFDARQEYLGPLCQGPSRDPLGEFLYAIAQHQEDRSLLPVWWKFCDLDQGIPWYHGLYGICGLRGLPPSTPEERGRFPEPVAIGLVRLAQGLYGRSQNQSLNKGEAKAEFQRVAKLVMSAYPFPERWREIWSNQIISMRLSDEPIEWMQVLFPGLDASHSRSQKGKSLLPSPSWKEDAKRIRKLLQKNYQTVLQEAEKLLLSERSYAEKTGHSYHFCRSLVSFANSIQKKYPEQAVRWMEEALTWEPWNPYIWSGLINAMCLDKRRSIDDVLLIAWQGIERFPNDVVVWTILAETLRTATKLTDAEAVYQEIILRFPNDVVALSGLAETLKAAGKLGEAEGIYRQIVQKFPDDVVALCGLAETLKVAGKLADAEAAYLKTIQKFPDNAIALSGLGETLKAVGKLGEAEGIYREIVQRFPDDVVALCGLAETLKVAGKLADAEAAYLKTIQKFPDDMVARTGLAAVLRLLGKNRLAEALALINEVISRESMNVEAWTEKARILEQLDQHEESNKIFEHISELEKSSLMKSKPDQEEKLNILVQDEQDLRREGAPIHTTALSSYARFLRRWARRVELTNGGLNPANLRQRAAEILDEMIRAKPHYARARSEKGLLLLEMQQYANAKHFLQESVQDFPGEATLRYALARAERELAKQEQRRLDQNRLSIIRAEWDQLRQLDPTFLPLKYLGEGRAWLAQFDGQIVRQESLKSFRRVREWMRPFLRLAGNGEALQTDDPENVRQHYDIKKGFEGWWSLEVQAYLFGKIDIDANLETEHLDFIVGRLERYGHDIDTLEEDFAIRCSF